MLFESLGRSRLSERPGQPSRAHPHAAGESDSDDQVREVAAVLAADP